MSSCTRMQNQPGLHLPMDLSSTTSWWGLVPLGQWLPGAWPKLDTEFSWLKQEGHNILFRLKKVFCVLNNQLMSLLHLFVS